MTAPKLHDWLRETRRSQAMPENGRPWTQEFFLERMRAETGWAPAYPNYNRYEQGKSKPRADTLKRITDYWRGKGVDIPAFADEPERELTLEERHVIALERAAAAAEAQVEATYAQTAMMRLLFTQIAGLAAPDGDDDDAVVRRTDDALRRRRSGLAPIGA